MIYGIGSDIVNITRLEKGPDFLNRFIKRSMSPVEQETMERRCLADNSARILYVAKRFAAKEAVAKAFGTGFRDGLYLSDIEVRNDNIGKPFVILHGQAAELYKKIGAKHIHLSLSDDYPFAQAVAVI